MWQAVVTRREFLDRVLSGQTGAISPINTAELFSSLPARKRELLISWRDDPRIDASFPTVAVMPDDELLDFFAALNASPSAPAPFSAFCRVISVSEAAQYSQHSSDTGGPRKILEALLGLSFAEAISHSGKLLKPLDLSPAICKRTVAYTWAKALANGVPLEQFNTLINGWFDALALTGAGERIPPMREVIDSEGIILRTAVEIFYGLPNPNASAISMLCEALVDGHKDSIEHFWQKLTFDLPNPVTLSAISTSTREERGSMFQTTLNSLYSTAPKDERTPAICAFLATQIAPGSFEHFEVLLSQDDRRLLLWYSFFAALQKPKGYLGFSGGLGSRLLRDVDFLEAFSSGPVGDVSLRELHVLSRGGLESLSKRIGHSNEIEVEIVPLATGNFRFSSRQFKQADLFEAHKATELPPNPEDILSPDEKLLQIIKTLESLRGNLNSGDTTSITKTPGRKPRKRDPR